MNDTFESQKEQLVSIKQEISLLYQQINYLLRNEKPLELLDCADEPHTHPLRYVMLR